MAYKGAFFNDLALEKMIPHDRKPLQAFRLPLLRSGRDSNSRPHA